MIDLATRAEERAWFERGAELHEQINQFGLTNFPLGGPDIDLSDYDTAMRNEIMKLDPMDLLKLIAHQHNHGLGIYSNVQNGHNADLRSFRFFIDHPIFLFEQHPPHDRIEQNMIGIAFDDWCWDQNIQVKQTPRINFFLQSPHPQIIGQILGFKCENDAFSFMMRWR